MTHPQTIRVPRSESTNTLSAATTGRAVTDAQCPFGVGATTVTHIEDESRPVVADTGEEVSK